MRSQQDRQMIFSSGSSNKEEHNSQKEGKSMSSANLDSVEIFFRREDIKILLLPPFPGTRCSEEPRERHSVFFY